MYLILWLLFGAVAGWIANKIISGSRKGLIVNIIVGLIGSLLGGWLASLIGLGSFTTFSIGGMLIAILGAIVFLSIINLLRRRN